MKIKFNEVTWYSKLGAVIVLFIIVPLISFYLGNYYQETKFIIKNISKVAPQKVGTSTNSFSSSTTVTSKPFKPLKGVICTMEAKQCADGSYVGRTGPNCEFTSCPKSK
ncbi:MAG: hypothetical protein WCF92_02360 [bacterium]